MPETVYIETTIVSYLSARTSKDLIQRARQQITRAWWRERRPHFELCVSPIVLQEAAAGHSSSSRARLKAMEGLTVLALTPSALRLAEVLVRQGPIPKKADVDALHISIAAVHGIDYLMTWNCAHIANASMRGAIEAICRTVGVKPPVLCTPEELMED